MKKNVFIKILLIIGIIFIIKGLCNYMDKQGEKAINWCVNEGNSYDYCVREYFRYES